jgi:hypothetical protein
MSKAQIRLALTHIHNEGVCDLTDCREYNVMIIPAQFISHHDFLADCTL